MKENPGSGRQLGRTRLDFLHFSEVFSVFFLYHIDQAV